MKAGRALLKAALLLGGASALSGCIAAAAIPVAASGAIARKQMKGSDERRAERRGEPVAQVAAVPVASPSPAPAAAASPAEAAEPVATAAQAAPPQPGAAPAGMQYLYGSGEAAALSIQTYQALYRYLEDRVADRKAGRDIAAVVLAPGATIQTPRFEKCGSKPLAAVFDIDETVLLNLGYEADEARRGTGYDDARWKRWEMTGAGKVAPVPGAVETIDAARRDGVTIVFNSNRSLANAPHTIAALELAGLGHADLGDTLWLRGDGPDAGGKDGRRWKISEKYCVVALVGDQLGDFSDLFNAGEGGPAVRRNIASQTMIAPLWGAGWFLLPNPVYGSGLKGGLDDIFPADKRWSDPAEEKR